MDEPSFREYKARKLESLKIAVTIPVLLVDLDPGIHRLDRTIRDPLPVNPIKTIYYLFLLVFESTGNTSESTYIVGNNSPIKLSIRCSAFSGLEVLLMYAYSSFLE